MSGICPCPNCRRGTGIGLVVAAAVVVAAVLAAVLWVIEYAVVLTVGAAGVAVATVALYRLALRHTVLSGPVRRAVAAPIQSPALTAARQRAAVMARPSRVLEGVVVDRIEVQR